ncbi:HEAT repeat-containing protein 4 [Mixophyes fleayi]|uniref:HEAT repeat-containing protein 4 n=1 Tax=Mixophyes fleayi TaxID=3061075 RepID=UPI003F4D96F6
MRYSLLVMERLSNYCEQRLGKNSIPLNRIQHPPFSLPVTKFSPSNQKSLQRQEKYIQNAAGDLNFSKEVIKDRGLASLSYQEWDSKDVYNPSDIISNVKRRAILKTQPKRHKLCYVGQSVTSKQFDVKSCVVFGNSQWRKGEKDGARHVGSTAHLSVESAKSKTFLTQVPSTSTNRMKGQSKVHLTSGSHNVSLSCNDVLLKMLTNTTAQWIKGRQTKCKNAKDRFFHQYGLSNSIQLIRDEHMREEDFRTCNELEKLKLQNDQVFMEELKPETLLPVYYKMPGYLSQPKPVQEVSGKNKTSESLTVTHLELSPPLRLQDLINPKAGKYVYATENEFERELYSGVGKIIHQKDTKEKNCIVMESNNRYKKHVQESLPRLYQEWCFSNEHTDTDRHLSPDRGVHRWLALPTAVVDEIKICTQDTSANEPCDRDKKVQQRPLNEIQVLQRIVSRWRSAWMFSASWKDATLEQLTRDLGSVHNTHKISALITIASSAVAVAHDETLPQEKAKIIDSPNRSLAVPPLPSEILNMVSNALRDEDALVRMAAALCQFLIREVSEEARELMFDFLDNGTDADSWAAAQCLALEGNHSYSVIKRILAQLFEVVNKETEELCCYLLHELSEHTNLILAMLGEALNSGNWRDRTMACRALSHLHGDISRDVKNKLNHLMWNDWNLTVRWEAAKALGKLGLGKEVHDQIRKHLECDSWKSKVEALSLIGRVRIMTAQLFPGFLQCFTNDVVAVRRQACQTAGVLQTKDEMVMNCLYQLIQNDPVWKIQAHAIKALGKIGHITPRVRELLLWAMRAEHPGVRIEAYRCVVLLHLCDSEVQHVLQDRLILESHELASRVVKQTLTALNMEHTGNQEMILMIKQQMPKLCQKEVLFPKVLKLNEAQESGHKEMKRRLKNTPSCRHKFQEPGFIWDEADKELTGKSCTSTMSGSGFRSTYSELQALVDDESRPMSQQAVNIQQSTSETSSTTAQQNIFRSTPR